jgi:hypothetical protein
VSATLDMRRRKKPLVLGELIEAQAKRGATRLVLRRDQRVQFIELLQAQVQPSIEWPSEGGFGWNGLEVVEAK